MPRQPMLAGAVCVWVALINMRSARMPLFLAAAALASSRNARESMQLSITTMASWVLPSSRTIARTLMGEPTSSSSRWRMPPLTWTGSCLGVASTTRAPARNAAWAGKRETKRPMARRVCSVFMVYRKSNLAGRVCATAKRVCQGVRSKAELDPCPLGFSLDFFVSCIFSQ